MRGVFSSEECEVLAEALDHAWEMFLKAGRLSPNNNDIAKGVLAHAVLQASRAGHRNPRELAMAAAASFDQYQDMIRTRRSWGSVPFLKAS